jgi:hypothetical protein
MLDILHVAGDEIVHAHHAKTVFDKTIAEM